MAGSEALQKSSNRLAEVFPTASPRNPEIPREEIQVHEAEAGDTFILERECAEALVCQDLSPQVSPSLWGPRLQTQPPAQGVHETNLEAPTLPEPTHSSQLKPTITRLEELDVFWEEFQKGFPSLSPEQQADALVKLRTVLYSDNIAALWEHLGELKKDLPRLHAESQASAPRIVKRIGPEIDKLVPLPGYQSQELQDHLEKIRTLESQLGELHQLDWEGLVQEDLTAAQARAEETFAFLWQAQVEMICYQVEESFSQVITLGNDREQKRLDKLQDRYQRWKAQQELGIRATDPFVNFAKGELDTILQDLKEISLHRSIAKLVSQRDFALSQLKSLNRWEQGMVETIDGNNVELYALQQESLQAATAFYDQLEIALAHCEARSYQKAAELMAQTMTEHDMTWLEDALERWGIIKGAGTLMITVVAGMVSGGTGLAVGRWVTALGPKASRLWSVLGSASGTVASGVSFTLMHRGMMFAWTGEVESELSLLEDAAFNTLMFGAMYKSLKLMRQYLFRGQQNEVLALATRRYMLDTQGKTFEEFYQAEWKAFIKQKPLVERMAAGLNLFYTEYGVMWATELSKAAYLQAKQGNQVDLNALASKHNTAAFHGQMLLNLIALKAGNHLGAKMMEPFKPAFRNVVSDVEARVHGFFHPEGPGLGPQRHPAGPGFPAETTSNQNSSTGKTWGNKFRELWVSLMTRKPGGPEGTDTTQETTEKTEVTALATREESPPAVKATELSSRITALANRAQAFGLKFWSSKRGRLLSYILTGDLTRSSIKDPGLVLPDELVRGRIIKHWLTLGPIINTVRVLAAIVEGKYNKYSQNILSIIRGERDSKTAIGSFARNEKNVLIQFLLGLIIEPYVFYGRIIKELLPSSEIKPSRVKNEVEKVLGISGTNLEAFYPKGYIKKIKPLLKIARQLPVLEAEQNQIFIEVCLNLYKPEPQSTGSKPYRDIEVNLEVSRQILLQVERFYQEEARSWRRRVIEEGLPENKTDEFIHDVLLPIYYRTWMRPAWTPQKVEGLTDFVFKAWVRDQKAPTKPSADYREGASSDPAQKANISPASDITQFFVGPYRDTKPGQYRIRGALRIPIGLVLRTPQEMVEETLQNIYQAFSGQPNP